MMNTKTRRDRRATLCLRATRHAPARALFAPVSMRCRLSRLMDPTVPPSDTASAGDEPLWQTILGCIGFALLYGLALVVR